jgi:hypothetical protein
MFNGFNDCVLECSKRHQPRWSLQQAKLGGHSGQLGLIVSLCLAVADVMQSAQVDEGVDQRILIG